jgi:alkanesulfonate monooxygenase SsuD/methylene tetrahydromethanopterin reductase-like flavin-dependent oxidoreductase (luciferase family)
VAKSVGTAAVVSGNRVALGVGIGWCAEEFDLLEQQFRTRGRRTDEGLALVKELWQPGWREFHGEFYDAPRLVMEPTPTAPVPIYVGGLSEIAFARAARHDGWVGDMYRTDEAIGWARRLAEVRAEAGATGDFAVILALTDAFLPEHFARAEEGGVTDCMTMPWMYYSGRDCPVEEKIAGMERFAGDVIHPLAA